MIKRYLAVLLMLFMALPVCACAGRPSQKRMEYVVETEVPESASCVSTKEAGNDICFVFKSDLRDLTFNVYALKNDTYPGYWPRVEYAKAVRDHYDDAIMKVLAPCRCFKNRNGTNEATAYEFKCTSDAEMREAAKAIADCNRIVADQFNFTPDADLTSPKIMYIRMLVLYESDKGDTMYGYALNGIDDEETVYRSILNGTL